MRMAMAFSLSPVRRQGEGAATLAKDKSQGTCLATQPATIGTQPGYGGETLRNTQLCSGHG